MKHLGEALGDAVFKAMVQASDRADLAYNVQVATNWGERSVALRAYYVEVWKVARTMPACDWAIDPYEINWPALFTPIEQAMWDAMRQERMVMYPQHPVAGYFVDFGNPKARVAIECDGKEFHQDRRRDAERQLEIERKGWRLYRFSGTDCFLSGFTETRDADGEESFVPSYARQQLREIARRFQVSRKHL